VSEPQPLGPIVDDLGVTLHLDPDDRVTDILVIAKTADLATGKVGLSMSSNDLDWIAKMGLLTAANVVLMDVDVEADD
jgi:hypothetical protein